MWCKKEGNEKVFSQSVFSLNTDGVVQAAAVLVHRLMMLIPAAIDMTNASNMEYPPANVIMNSWNAYAIKEIRIHKREETQTLCMNL